MLEDLFPKTIFTEEYVKRYGLNKAISKQLEVITGELFEARDAASRENYEHTLEELTDSIQGIFTLLYMIPEYSETKLRKYIIKVQEKNYKRGYITNTGRNDSTDDAGNII